MSGWVSTEWSPRLSGRRSRDTAPEVALRRAVHARGGRFRLHRRLAKGCTPDFVMPARRLAVFVDGCFWHGCPAHGKSDWSGPNAALWAEKMRANRERDERAGRTARSLGWAVARVWECEVRADPDAAAARLLSNY